MIKLNSVEFGEYFAELRLKAGFVTQSELAKEAGVERSTISRIETGDTKTPSFDSLSKIAPLLKVSKEELLSAAGLITLHTEHTPELKEMIRLFNGLSPKAQEYILKQIRNLSDYDQQSATTELRA
jgi:transcriptional regulator with XRE-family HTH domain